MGRIIRIIENIFTLPYCNFNVSFSYQTCLSMKCKTVFYDLPWCKAICKQRRSILFFLNLHQSVCHCILQCVLLWRFENLEFYLCMHCFLPCRMALKRYHSVQIRFPCLMWSQTCPEALPSVPEQNHDKTVPDGHYMMCFWLHQNLRSFLVQFSSWIHSCN